MYESLRARWTPERVVDHLLDHHRRRFSAREVSLLEKGASRWRSGMGDRFAAADDPTRQLAKAQELFGIPAPPASDTEAVQSYVERLREILGAHGDFKHGRQSRQERREAGKVSGRRAYNKRFRLLGRLREKIIRCAEVENLRYLAQVAKSGLALEVRREDFDADPVTGCFLAYYTATLNRRSVFTNGPQARAFDEIASMLYKKLDDRTRWFAVAHVYPQPDVMSRLSDEEKGQILGRWYSVMLRAIRVLDQERRKPGLDLDDMVVQRGNDSSTWNEAAGAYNKAREGWMNALVAFGQQDLLAVHMPGKMLRLMAADVVRWHRGCGGLDPDTLVWRTLPKPWEVIIEHVPCSAEDIEAACKAAGVEGRGWTRPREQRVAPVISTPELVHGVEVCSPAMAALMRKEGWFAGPSKKKAS